MTFLENFRPADEPRHAGRKRRPHFHGGMSFRCLVAAADCGSDALLTYLLAWHLHHLGKKEWIELNAKNSGLAGLTEHRRQAALRKLAQQNHVLQVQQRAGRPPLVRPVDPWPEETYFLGHMSWECLKQAAQQGGASLAVYVIALHEYNLARRQPIRLGQSQRQTLGLKRSSWNRAIHRLEKADLLHILAQRPGSSPVALPLDPWRPYQSDVTAPSYAAGDLGRQVRGPPVLPLALPAACSSAG